MFDKFHQRDHIGARCAWLNRAVYLSDWHAFTRPVLTGSSSTSPLVYESVDVCDRMRARF